MTTGNDGRIDLSIVCGLRELFKDPLINYPDNSLPILFTKDIAPATSNDVVELPDLGTLEGVLFILDTTNSGSLTVKMNGEATARLLKPLFAITVNSTYPLTALTATNAHATLTKTVTVVGLLKGS
jgi:hypothetical protein